MKLLRVVLFILISIQSVESSNSSTANQSVESSNSSTDPCSRNIYIPVVMCLCDALLLSLVVNVYFICMTRYRQRCQDRYTLTTNCVAVRSEPSEIQFEAVETQNDSSENEEQPDESKETCVYSDVKVVRKN